MQRMMLVGLRVGLLSNTELVILSSDCTIGNSLLLYIAVQDARVLLDTKLLLLNFGSYTRKDSKRI